MKTKKKNIEKSLWCRKNFMPSKETEFQKDFMNLSPEEICRIILKQNQNKKREKDHCLTLDFRTCTATACPPKWNNDPY